MCPFPLLERGEECCRESEIQKKKKERIYCSTLEQDRKVKERQAFLSLKENWGQERGTDGPSLTYGIYNDQHPTYCMLIDQY